MELKELEIRKCSSDLQRISWDMNESKLFEVVNHIRSNWDPYQK